jgi:hypothetical protein
MELSKAKRLAIFDFDGTLVLTPEREDGIRIWKEQKGFIWPHRGYWGRRESLEAPILPWPPAQELLQQHIADQFHQAKTDGETYTVLMTGRHGGLEKHVQRILDHYGLYADAEFFKAHPSLVNHPKYPRQSDETFDYKWHVICDRLLHPGIQILEIWEDQERWLRKFLHHAPDLQTPYPHLTWKIHDVTKNEDYQGGGTIPVD